MTLSSISRIVSDLFIKREPRENYWMVRKTLARLGRLFENSNRVFARHVAKDLSRYLAASIEPISGETTERARAAVDWLLRAQNAADDGGVSLGYFPCDEQNGWRVSYPETTGYIVTSLLEFARRYGDEQVRQSALRMARWEVSIQMPSGAVQGGPVCPPEKRTPCAFNTGMVLDGWSAAYRSSGDSVFLEAARRASEFLVHDLTDEGYFRTNGEFVTSEEIKTYNCLCAWPLYHIGTDAHNLDYQKAAVRIVEAALRLQQPNGWFSYNCLTRSDAPLLHTIGYTLQGVLEVGRLADREDFIAAARRGVDALLPRISSKGFLHGRFYGNWQPASLSSCLTGSAQFAVVCYGLFECTGSRQYLNTAERIVNYLKALQATDSPNPGINGALAGSFPILGSYMTAGYPNWATKYFLDALMLQDGLRGC
jgi:hypothetical protein